MWFIGQYNHMIEFNLRNIICNIAGIVPKLFPFPHYKMRGTNFSFTLVPKAFTI